MRTKILAAAAAAATVLVSVGVAPQASAFQGWDYNTATIVNAKSVYNAGEPIHITATLAPNTTYYVGQCTWKSYFLKAVPFVRVPACTTNNLISVKTDASGKLDAYFKAVASGKNVHYKYTWSAPETIDFSNPKNAAELVVIKDIHHGEYGVRTSDFKGIQSTDTLQTFTVD